MLVKTGVGAGPLSEARHGAVGGPAILADGNLMSCSHDHANGL